MRNAIIHAVVSFLTCRRRVYGVAYSLAAVAVPVKSKDGPSTIMMEPTAIRHLVSLGWKVPSATKKMFKRHKRRHLSTCLFEPGLMQQTVMIVLILNSSR